VLEPGDGKAYDRDPRSIRQAREAYLKASGLGDTAFFGPEPEFFIFDDVRWGADPSGCFVEIDEYEAPWNTGKKIEGGNKGHRPTTKGGYFPVPPIDSTQDMRAEMSLILEQLGIPVEVFHHEVAAAGQNEIGTRFSTLVQRADWTILQKYVIHNVANAYGKTATFMPKPIVGDNGSGMHVHQSVVEGRQEPVRRRRLRGAVGVRAVLHRRRDQACARAERHHQPRHQQLQAPGARLRGPGEARYSARNRSASIRIPYVANPKAVHRGALPDPMMNPYLGFAAMLMAGLDGIENKIHPGEAATKDLYHLPPEEDAKIPTVCHSLEQALEYLDQDPPSSPRAACSATPCSTPTSN